MSSPPPPAVRPHTQKPYLYFILVYFAAFLYAAVTPLVYLLTFLQYGSRPSQNTFVSMLSNPDISTAFTVGQWLIFFAVFYFIGKRVDFPNDYGNLAILTYGGILTSYFVFQLSYQITVGGGFSPLLVQQEIGYVVSAVAGFGLLFGAMSLAFLRTQLPFSDAPPLELMTYRNPSSVGLVALLTSFASRVLSAFIAALIFQEGLFRGDQFNFLSYYYSNGDPLYANFIIYPGLFMILLYYIGKKIDFHRELRRVVWYLFTGGFVGYAIGTPLGFYLKVFFNALPRSSPAASAISQLYAISAQSIIVSALEAALLMLLGISVLTIALLLRRSDVPRDDEEDDGGYDEEVPTQAGQDSGNSPSTADNLAAQSS